MLSYIYQPAKIKYIIHTIFYILSLRKVFLKLKELDSLKVLELCLNHFLNLLDSYDSILHSQREAVSPYGSLAASLTRKDIAPLHLNPVVPLLH